MGWVSDRTLSNSYSSTIGNFTLRTCCQCSKMGTDHLFLYLVDFGTALSMQSSSSIVSGSKTFLRPWQKQYVNYFKVITRLEYKFGATRNYWLIKNKSSQYSECRLNTTNHTYNAFYRKMGKIQHCIILYCFFEEVISKTRASGFIRFPEAWKQ